MFDNLIGWLPTVIPDRRLAEDAVLAVLVTGLVFACCAVVYTVGRWLRQLLGNWRKMLMPRRTKVILPEAVQVRLADAFTDEVFKLVLENKLTMGDAHRLFAQQARKTGMYAQYMAGRLPKHPDPHVLKRLIKFRLAWCKKHPANVFFGGTAEQVVSTKKASVEDMISALNAKYA